jgi:signal transduction histidine kinase
MNHNEMNTDQPTCSLVADPALFTRISRLISTGDTVDVVLQAILDESVRATNAARGFLAIVDRDRGELNARYVAGDGWTEERRISRLKVSEETGRGITSHVAATGQPYYSPNVQEDPYYIMSFEDVRSELAVPLVDSYKRTLGVINVESLELDGFGEPEENAVTALADLGTIAITIFDYRAREEAMLQIGQELASLADEQEILQKVIDVTADALKFEDCSLFLIDPASGKLVLRASRGALAEQIGRATYDLGQGLTGWTALHHEVVRLAHPDKDPRWLGRFEELPASEVGAFMAVPVRGHRDEIGVLRVQRKKSAYRWFPNDFTEDDERILASIATELGTALDNARLVRQLVRTERMAAWGEMSARSAHMIGNRVFAIKGDINELKHLCAQGQMDVKEATRLSESIEKGIFLLEELLNEFREFVKATQIELEMADVNTLVREAIDESFPKRTEVKLKLELADELPEVEADATKLKRSLSELIENSVGFIAGPGEIEISTGMADAESKQWLRPRQKSGQFVQIRLSDTGPGIDRENKPKIFNPFYTSRAKGMGLGLSIVKGIVDAHNGVIFESGTPGEGAKFTILLPVPKEKRA